MPTSFIPSYFEERIFICDGQAFIWEVTPGGTDRICRPCGNLMRIIVTKPTDIGPTYVECAKPTKDTNGCCLSKVWRYGSNLYTGKFIIKYGPKPVILFSLVMCLNCKKRISWKKFRKADI